MAENGASVPAHSSSEETGFAESKGKGKGKAAEPASHREDAAMDEDGEDDVVDEDEDDDDDEDDEDDDGLEEIDLDNIVDGGRRTRGTTIDFAKAAESLPADEDDEDDEDFEPPSEDAEMAD
ncbi:hypothetical protein UVI_02058410 [Ustilaginoidea virens]|uniref:Histone chaperone domain-containing protein n=1 Tax=Ustilaginoidea virens TaxID=1159556 RepID=A0A1B5L3L4_USTVR|nr:hypothetical protein UVI_02058410 [Ustilaginoidea virens]